jgi:hypothetical protein
MALLSWARPSVCRKVDLPPCMAPGTFAGLLLECISAAAQSPCCRRRRTSQDTETRPKPQTGVGSFVRADRAGGVSGSERMVLARLVSPWDSNYCFQRDPDGRGEDRAAGQVPLRPGDPCSLCVPGASGPQGCGLVYLVMSDLDLRERLHQMRLADRARPVGPNGTVASRRKPALSFPAAENHRQIHTRRPPWEGPPKAKERSP